MSTSDNSRVSDADIRSALKLLTSVGHVEFWVNGRQVWAKNLTTGTAYLFVELATVSSIWAANKIFGGENLRGSESARSQKGSTGRKATKSVKKS